MEKRKKELKGEKDYDETSDSDREKFGESGVKLLNLIAEILVDKVLKDMPGAVSEAD